MSSLKPGFHEQAIVAVYGALSRRGYNAPKRLGVSLHHLDRHAGPDAGPWLPAEIHLEAVRGMSLDRRDLDANAWRELGFDAMAAHAAALRGALRAPTPCYAVHALERLLNSVINYARVELIEHRLFSARVRVDITPACPALWWILEGATSAALSHIGVPGVSVDHEETETGATFSLRWQ